MAPIRNLFLCAGICALAACATHPSPGVAIGSDTLSLCAMRVANAPAADRNGRITNYDPYGEFSGVVLARAPVDACVSSGFGPRRGGAGSFHHGVDLYTRTPGNVYAGGDGVIDSVSSQRGYGKTVVIRHNDRVISRYAHLSAYARGLSKGDRVRQGEIIGLTGNTGNATAVHLHYEIRVRGNAVDPLTVGR